VWQWDPFGQLALVRAWRFHKFRFTDEAQGWLITTLQHLPPPILPECLYDLYDF
jgi:hypothetical protein